VSLAIIFQNNKGMILDMRLLFSGIGIVVYTSYNTDMRVLLLCDDYWYPGQIPIDGVAPLAAQGFQFDIITNANDFTPDMLLSYPVVVMSY